MNLEVQYAGGSKFTATARTHTLICDQPPENGGHDTGMTPPELLLAALGTCIGYYAAEYLKTRNLSGDGLKVSVSAEKAKQPARLGRFEVEVMIPSALEARHVAGIERAVHACLIHNTLRQPPEIHISVHPGAPGQPELAEVHSSEPHD